MIDNNAIEKEILNSFSPNLLRRLILLDSVNSLLLIKKSRIRCIEEIEVHYENVKKNNGHIIGYRSLKKHLKENKENNVYILSGHNEKYGFDLYLNESKSCVIGVAIIKLRVKSADEIKWERDVLGIKHHK